MALTSGKSAGRANLVDFIAVPARCTLKTTPDATVIRGPALAINWKLFAILGHFTFGTIAVFSLAIVDRYFEIEEGKVFAAVYFSGWALGVLAWLTEPRHRFTLDTAGLEVAREVAHVALSRQRFSAADVESFEFDDAESEIVANCFAGPRRVIARHGILFWLRDKRSRVRLTTGWIIAKLNEESRRLWGDPLERAARAGKAEL